MLISNEEAKAIEETAKTTGKGIDLITQIGSVIAPPIKEGIGILHDAILYKRWEIQQKLNDKIIRKQKEMGNEYTAKNIEFKLAVPLFEAATLEEDEYMQELWTNLLINASYEESNVELNRTFIDVLERLNSFEAKILMEIYRVADVEEGRWISTIYLPDTAVIQDEENKKNARDIPEDERVILALSNLAVLGCIKNGGAFADETFFGIAKTTFLGVQLVKSCTLNFEK